MTLPNDGTDAPAVTLTLSPDVLRPLVQSVLAETGHFPGWPAGRLSLDEHEAAAAIGLEPHVLRDARIRCKLPHDRFGRTVVYTSKQLTAAFKQMEVN